MSMRLFDITSQFKALAQLEDSDDIASEVIADTLEGLEGDFEAKAIAVSKFILSLEASADSIKEAAKAMDLRAARLSKRADSIRHYLLLQMQIIDWRRKIEADDIVIARRNNPVAVQVLDESSVPPSFWVQPEPPPKRIDKKAVKEALQSGAEVPGCVLESGERVDIRL
jgi:Siphovirus Gp157